MNTNTYSEPAGARPRLYVLFDPGYTNDVMSEHGTREPDAAPLHPPSAAAEPSEESPRVLSRSVSLPALPERRSA